MEPTAETATAIAKGWRNMIERRSNMLATDVNVLERQFIAAITAAEARAEARGREAERNYLATLITSTPIVRREPHPSCGYNSIPLGAGEFKRTIIEAISSRTGEGKADSADSGEEDLGQNG